MNEPEGNRNIVAGADHDAGSTSDASQGNSSPYLKLIADCWEYIFDHLSIRDILVMGQTCRRMAQMAGYYVREYHPNLEFHQIGREIQLPSFSNFQIQSDFYQFISGLYITRTNDIDFLLNIPTSDSLKTLIFDRSSLAEARIRYTRNILKNIESIHLIECRSTGNIFEQFVTYCPNLKHLDVRRCRAMNSVLFLQYYPELECLQFRLPAKNVANRNDELKMFLLKHLNLNQLGMSYHFLWANRDVLNETNIQLDLLSVHFEKTENHGYAPHQYHDYGVGHYGNFANFLRGLFERGFYKSLQLSIHYAIKSSDVEQVSNIISTLPALESFSIYSDSFVGLNRLTNLKNLHITTILSDSRMNILARNLRNLERLTILEASFAGIVPFICHSTRLKSILVCDIRNDMALANIDLITLNAERRKLINPCHISLYVPEDVYLLEKWKTRNLNSDLIKVMRLDSQYFVSNR